MVNSLSLSMDIFYPMNIKHFGLVDIVIPNFDRTRWLDFLISKNRIENEKVDAQCYEGWAQRK